MVATFLRSGPVPARRRGRVALLGALAGLLLLPAASSPAFTGPAEPGTRLMPSGGGAATPEAIWEALMPAAYGAHDPARGCWTAVLRDRASGEEGSFCMRPLHAAPAPGAETLMLLVAAGHEFGADIARYDCHACAGALGLFLVERDGDAAVLRASLPLARLGAWGETAPAHLVVPLRLGAARWGWALGFDYNDRGTLRRQFSLFGSTGSEIRPLGHVDLSEYWGAAAAGAAPLAIAADRSDPAAAAYPLVLAAPPGASGPDRLRLEPGGGVEGDGYRVRGR